MSNMDDYYIKMTKIPKVTQQGAALNTFELANTEVEKINALPVFTEQKRIEAADESLNQGQYQALNPLPSQALLAHEPGALATGLTDKQRLIGFGFLAYLAFKFLK